MSLVPNLTVTINESTVVLDDNTTYGGGESARSAVTVNFSGAYVASDGTETSITIPTYDEDTVTQVVLSDLDDGRVTFTMTIVDGEETLTETVDTIIYSDLLSCFNTKKRTYFRACGDCEIEPCEISDVLVLNTGINVLQEEIDAERIGNAECIYNGLYALCNDDEDCAEC